MRHATAAMRASGCECDGCRLTAFLTPQRGTYNVRTKVDPAPTRALIQRAVAAGVTLSDLAAAAGVSRQELTRIWYGRTPSLWPRTAARIAAAVNA